MAIALVAGGSPDAVRMGLTCLNKAVVMGLTDSNVADATGINNLCDTVIPGLALLAGTSADAARQAGAGLKLGFQAIGVADSDVTGAADIAAVRAFFTQVDTTLSGTYASGGLHG